MKRAATWIASLCLALCSTACERAEQADRFISIGTAGTGGVYYPLGGALASRLSALDSARSYTAEVTGGSVENIKRIASGEMQLGFTVSTSAYEAYHGGEGFPEPVTRLRIAAPVHPNVTHVLVGASARITSLGELRGRRVSVGAPGSGTEQVAKHVLEAYGLTYDSVQPRYLSFTESVAALADGGIDAAIISAGYPASAVLEALTTGRARLLPIDSARAQLLVDRYPYYSADVIPARGYPGQRENVATVSVLNWLVARDDLPDTIVQLLLDLLEREQEQLRQVVQIAGQIDLGRLRSAPIPLHDAARAWLSTR